MPPDALQQTSAGVLLCVALAVAVAVQARVIRRIARDGGQVPTADFVMPDALVAFVLATFFIGLGISAVVRHAEKGHAVKIEQVIPGSLVFVVIAAGVAGFLQYRGLKLVPQLGLGRVPPLRVVGFLTFRGARVPALLGLTRLGPLRVLGWALGLLLTAFAFVAVANLFTVALLHGHTEPQELVQLFRTVAQHGESTAMLKILLAGALLAPVCEEFLFRGFFYAVGKRYLGPLASGFLTAVLFAAVHQSLTAFAGLFVLAVCFTLAYERTGSLLVPIGMHALYNSTSLLFIWLQARGAFPTL